MALAAIYDRRESKRRKGPVLCHVRKHQISSAIRIEFGTTKLADTFQLE
jgi:hypothetical protein